MTYKFANIYKPRKSIYIYSFLLYILREINLQSPGSAKLTI